jgi:hypothetical protein
LGGGGVKFCNPTIARRRYACVQLPDQPDTRIAKAGNRCAGAIRRSVIDDHQRPVAMRLRQHRRDRVANPGGRIVRRNDNADVHTQQPAHPRVKAALTFRFGAGSSPLVKGQFRLGQLGDLPCLPATAVPIDPRIPECHET